MAALHARPQAAAIACVGVAVGIGRHAVMQAVGEEPGGGEPVAGVGATFGRDVLEAGTARQNGVRRVTGPVGSPGSVGSVGSVGSGGVTGGV